MFVNYLMVAVGAVFGVLGRVLLSNWIKSKWTYTFPMATFIVNISGALVLGFTASLGLGTRLSLLFGTGFIGTYTTFSTFNFENIELLRRKKNKSFITYIGGSYGLGIIAIFAGMALGGVLRAGMGI